MKPIAIYWKTLIQGGGGPVGALFRAVLWGISQVYSLVSDCRHLAYDRGWLRRRRPQGPVIVSIGNIVVGGTGKTPVVVKFGQALQTVGSVAILTRGYRSPAETANTPVYIAPGHCSSAAICGDEPFLMTQRLPKAHLVVGRDRYAAAQMAVSAGAQLLLLDDGLQHRQLARDFDVVVVDADFPFGGGHLFPRGALRESPEGLRRAQLIVVNHVRSQDHFQRVKRTLSAFTSAPMVGMRPTVSAIIPLTLTPLGQLRGLKVGIFCGIAHPERFVETAMTLGVDVVGTLFSADHALPSMGKLKTFALQCQQQGATWLLCTQKDVVKLPPIAQISLPMASVQIELEIVAGHENWLQCIDQIRSKIGNIPLTAGVNY